MAHRQPLLHWLCIETAEPVLPGREILSLDGQRNLLATNRHSFTPMPRTRQS
jgi:hypothetical protein